jgi:hypothetical protein
VTMLRGGRKRLEYSIATAFIPEALLRFQVRTFVFPFPLRFHDINVLLIYLIIYLLTELNKVLEKLTGCQLVNKLSAFFGTRMFITAFTSTPHMSLSCGRSTQYMSPVLFPEDPA